MDHTEAIAALGDLAAEPTGVYIGGEWEVGAGEVVDDIDPTTGESFATVPLGDAKQIGRAVETARAAQQEWSELTYAARAEYLWRLLRLLERDWDFLARLISLEVGKPLKHANGEMVFGTKLVRFMASAAHHVTGEIVPSDDPRETIYLHRVPYGVVGGICAWNFPVAMLFRKLAPALLTGNTVVIKPSEISPICAIAVARLCEEAGVPPGVVNIVTGGKEVGASLVSDERVDFVSMTGSVAGGKAVVRESADHLPKVSLELGGKAPAIVWNDADIDLAAQALITARLTNTGQVCTCAERLYVHRDVHDALTQRFAELASALKVGDPLDPDTDIGPLSSAMQHTKVRSIVQEALAGGAVESPEIQATMPTNGGYWQKPMLLAGASPDMRVMREEVFGPILPVVAVDTLDQALELANDTDRGLTAFVFSQSYPVINEVNRRIKSGALYVNRTHGSAVQAFHSGHRQSGVGGEDGMHGLLEYTQIRTTYMKF